MLICNEQSPGRDLSLNSIEAEKRLQLFGGGNRQRSPYQSIRIKYMEGLPQSDHDVVGDIDCIVDRFHPTCEESLLEPFRRGANLHTANPTAHIARAKGRILYNHPNFVSDGDHAFVLESSGCITKGLLQSS